MFRSFINVSRALPNRGAAVFDLHLRIPARMNFLTIYLLIATALAAPVFQENSLSSRGTVSLNILPKSLVDMDPSAPRRAAFATILTMAMKLVVESSSVPSCWNQTVVSFPNALIRHKIAVLIGIESCWPGCQLLGDSCNGDLTC